MVVTGRCIEYHVHLMPVKSIMVTWGWSWVHCWHQGSGQWTDTRDTWDFIWTKHPHLPTFYTLPKVHKDLHDPPGRPIISGSGSISEGISQIIDQHLRPHVMDLPSYTRNTIHLLQILDNLVVPDSAILVTVFFCWERCQLCILTTF